MVIKITKILCFRPIRFSLKVSFMDKLFVLISSRQGIRIRIISVIIKPENSSLFCTAAPKVNNPIPNNKYKVFTSNIEILFLYLI